MPFQDKHNRVTLAYPFRFEEISCLITIVLHLCECKDAFIALIVAPNHCYLIRISGGYFINNIICKVEILRNIEFDSGTGGTTINTKPTKKSFKEYFRLKRS